MQMKLGKIHSLKIISYFTMLVLFVMGSIFLLHLESRRISTLIVPHHDLVAKERQELFSHIAQSQQPSTIILLSPNHYDLGSDDFQTRSTDLTTKHGTIKLNQALYKKALNAGATDNPATFASEHGIITILPDIKEYFPNASILPIVVKTDADAAKSSALIDNLAASCRNCMLIASVDFSHYQPYLLSKLHDDLSIRALKTLDTDLVRTKSEVDAPNILAAAMRWAKLHNTNHYVEYNHTNSNLIANDYYLEGTTHEFGWYESGRPASAIKEASFTFMGNVAFGSAVNERFKRDYAQQFSQLGDRVLWGTDISATSLYSSATRNTNQVKPDFCDSFGFNQKTISVISSLHINHVLFQDKTTNCLRKDENKNFVTSLNKASITPLESANNPTIIRGNGQSIVLFGLDTTANDTLDPAQIRKLSNETSNNIVIYVHWQSSYQVKPSEEQVALAHSWVDAGADLIVGVGSDVIHPVERYKNRPIFYSLGNFTTESSDTATNLYSLVITGKFTEKSVEVMPLIIGSKASQPILQRSKTVDDHVLSANLQDISPNLTDRRGGLLFSFSK